MKLELIKEQKQIEPVKYWVKVNDSYVTSLTKLFVSEDEANDYYDTLVKLSKEYGTKEETVILRTCEI